MRNDTHLFYSGIIAATANFADNAFKLKLGASRLVKIKVTGATAQISFNNNDVDADVLVGEELCLEHMQTAKISIRGAGASVRVWAY